MPTTVGHSHRPTTKVAHKSFKSKKATKSALRDQAKGKVPSQRGLRKTPHQQVMTKLDRRNQAKQRGLQKLREHQREASIFNSRHGAPRIVAVVPLCSDSDTSAAIKNLNASLDIETKILDPHSSFRVPVGRFKQTLQYVPLKRDLTACLDGARAADFVVFLLSAETEVDPVGELIIRSIENQGMSTCFSVVQYLDSIQPAKARPDVVKSLASFMTHFHPDQNKIYNLDSRQECSNMMRSLCSTMPKGINWRDQRSWMLVDQIEWPSQPSESTVFTGVVRGKGLNADRLVHIGDWGTFQVEKITSPLFSNKKAEGGSDMAVDPPQSEVTVTPTGDQDGLEELAPEETVMSEANDAVSTVESTKKGVLLDDHHYFSEDEFTKSAQPVQLPKGTSSYQSAWFLDDVSDSESDLDDDDDDEMEEAHTQEKDVPDDMEMLNEADPTEVTMSEYPRSEKFEELDEEANAQQLAAYRASKRSEVQDDLEFPDEIELHPNVLASERLAKYRGLKSLHSSPWNVDEDLPYQPADWTRLLQISDYQSSRNRALRETLVGGIAPGTRVRVFLKGVPPELQEKYQISQPLTLFSLLRHENKKTALNVEIRHKDDYKKSIKAKEELIMQCGPRRFIINPLFSLSGTTENDVHKYCRFLHPGQSAIASFTGPVTWGAVPTLFFKRTVPETGSENEQTPAQSSSLQLVAVGTMRAPSTTRVTTKRVVLTGHPYHIHKKLVTIRYMFFNREDVEWFKALPLWTKRGRTGYFKEPLGTHGYFKATFDGRINPQDSVGVNLYKRVWPRSARPLRGSLVEGGEVGGGGGMDEDVD